MIEEQGQPVIYAELNKALYGTLQAALLFLQNLFKFLIEEHGFTVSPYNWIVNKMIDGAQCTIGCHLDDLKISHVNETLTESIVATLQAKYSKETPLVIHWGKVHDYLRMTIDYSAPGKVWFSMDQYIDNLFTECPDQLMKGTGTTPTANHLVDVNDACPKLDTEDAILYHHLITKLLYLCKQTRPNIQLAMSFLTTCMQSPDEDDNKKIGHCIGYLWDSWGLN